LEEISIPDFVDFELLSQKLIRDLSRQNAPIMGPFFLQLELLNDRIKNTCALNDLINSRRKLGIMNRHIGIALAEDARIFSRRFHLHEHGRLVDARLKIGENRGADYHQQKRKQHQLPVDADYAPIIEK